MEPVAGKSNMQTRREFGSSALGMAALFTAFSNVGGQEVPVPDSDETLPSADFTFGTVYTGYETRRLLQPGKGLGPGPRVGIPFWWDREAKLLVNPTNNTFDPSIKAADYQLSAAILSFRASQRELGANVWRRLSNNAQVNINPASLSVDGDILNWVLMTGIEIAQNIFGGKDGQLASVNQNNKPTDTLPKSEAVVFRKGQCSLAITINAQRKESIWDKLLRAIQAFAGSAVFGVLPIPKLYQTALKSVTAALKQLQDQSKVIRVLAGNSYEYKLYNGANSSADLTFRPGHWVIVDSEFARAHMDQNYNLSKIYLDVPGLLYELKDANDRPVDTTYTIVDLRLSEASASGEKRQ